MANELHTPPGNVVRWLLVENGYASVPNSGGDWPIFHMGEPGSPDNVLTVYDIAGRDTGRSQIGGHLFFLYGVYLRVRAMDQADGFLKADSLRRALAEDLTDVRVTVDGIRYVVNSFASISQVFLLGKETAGKRSLFTVNALVALREI